MNEWASNGLYSVSLKTVILCASHLHEISHFSQLFFPSNDAPCHWFQWRHLIRSVLNPDSGKLHEWRNEQRTGRWIPIECAEQNQRCQNTGERTWVVTNSCIENNVFFSPNHVLTKYQFNQEIITDRTEVWVLRRVRISINAIEKVSPIISSLLYDLRIPQNIFQC